MKKIVISSDQTEGNCGLIALVDALFPECEICVVSAKEEGADSHSNEFLPY